MELFLPCLYAFLACFFFGVVFELHRWRYLLSAGLTGGLGWLVYLLLADHGSVLRFFFATIVVASLAEVFARIYKAPATIFLIIGIVPLVPGGGMYETMEALINHDMPLFAERGLATAASAGAIAVGCSLVSAVARILAVKRRERHARQRLKQTEKTEES